MIKQICILFICMFLLPTALLAEMDVRQSTTITITVTMEDLDGYPVRSASLSNFDFAEMHKPNGGSVVDLKGRTWTERGNGAYDLTLLASDIDTLGLALIHLADTSGGLIENYDVKVVIANVYDSKYSTDKLEVDVTQFEGADASDTLIGTDSDTLETLSDQIDSCNTTTPPTAVAIREEMDSNSTQLAAILEDTGTTIPATLSTIWEKLKRLVF